MAHEREIPRLTPDGKPTRPRKGGDDTERGAVGKGDDPAIAGDEDKPGYANTGEAGADEDGLVRNTDEPPLI